MEVTYQQLVEMNQALPELVRHFMVKGQIKQAQAAAQVGVEIRAGLGVLEICRAALRAKHSNPDAEGNPVIPPGSQEEEDFRRDVLELTAETVQVKADPVPIDPADLAELDPGIFMLLAPILTAKETGG